MALAPRARRDGAVSCDQHASQKNSEGENMVIRLTLAVAPIATPAAARDIEGRYGKLDPKMHEWFEHLQSGKGPCCADADGQAVLDSDWEVVGNHYRVFLDGQWLDVPDDAVLTQPNLCGRTVVWPIKTFAGMTIRCFLPGSMM
jgi:hypothetical protein